jgi:hypothetical protein
MNENLYVATDAMGVDHSSVDKVAWLLPEDGNVQITKSDHPLVLRQPKALLEVLDQRIYLADSPTDVKIGADGTASVSTARLTLRTQWNADSATKFALDCADHLLGEVGDSPLPNGMSLVKVTADARQVLYGTATEPKEHLGRLASMSALRRLRRDRTKIASASLDELDEAMAKDLEAFDDPTFATEQTVIDAVLASIEALRHVVLPALYMAFDDAGETHGDHMVEDSKGQIPTPQWIETGFGAIGLHVPKFPFDPAWVNAREAARHARDAMNDHGGADGEISELIWQAKTLAAILQAPESPIVTSVDH